MNKNELLIEYGSDPKQMAISLLNAAKIWELIGDKGARIGLKPNLVVARPAREGATTHPELLAGTIEVLKEHGFLNIVILEGSWVGDQTRRAFDVCGYAELAKRYGVTLIDTKHDGYKEYDCAGLPINICNSAMELDFLINMPVLKGHCQTAVTCALKNMKGVIPDKEKRRFHSLGLHKPIAHLGTRVKQSFILVDGICGDLNFEEGGNPVPMHRAIAGLDPVLVDAYVAELMGFSVEEIPYIGMAQALGVGNADTKAARVTELSSPKTRQPMRASGRVGQLAKHINENSACSACYASLVFALERLDDEGLLKKLKQPIAIGQGFAGCQGALGVGKCTSGFDAHVAGCPPKAVDILTFIKEQI